jgi:hypothetical protein|tara:strand:- start:404 stop:607 length:204 start_codon:yes stop_codon:yes gene_type:complete
MSNYTEQHDKLAVHLQELYKRHRTLDDEIKVLYNKFVEDHELNLLKTKKLWLKDEIHRLESELKALQ